MIRRSKEPLSRMRRLFTRILSPMGAGRRLRGLVPAQASAPRSRRIQAIQLGCLVALGLALGCGDDERREPRVGVEQPIHRPIGRTLGKAIERGSLRVLILPRSERYLPRDGSSTLHERDLVEEFARDLGLSVQFVNVAALGELIPALLEGRGDLIASNFTNTAARSQQVAFSSPLEVVREQVVTRQDDSRLDTEEDLLGRRLAVLRGSAHFQTAVSLALFAPGIEVETAQPAAVTEDLLQGVGTGRYDIALVDSNLMSAASSWHPELRVAFAVGDTRMIAWAMRKGDTELRRAVDSFLARRHQGVEEIETADPDLPGILERRRLRVLTRNAATTYFVWRGELVGFEYELINHFAKRFDGVRVEMVVPPRGEDLIPWLLAGKGDVIAAGLTASEERASREGIHFSRGYLEVSEQVVTRADDAGLSSPQDLTGRSFVVRKSSSYWHTLNALRDRGLDIEILAAPEEFGTEEIVARVATGEYDLTLADSHLIDVEMALRDDIRTAFPLGEARRLGWAVRPDSPKLLEAINEFWADEYRGLFYNVTARKYFGSDRALRDLAGAPAHRSGEISPFDDLVREFAAQYGFDWRLIVAQMHQESRFDPEAESFAGAQGLLQVMPRTAQQLDLHDLHKPRIGIEAGVKYLAWVRERFEPELPAGQRTWFALAAYNAGAGHVRDARKLAAQMGLDPNVWFDNVEEAMKLKQDASVHPTTRFGYCNGEEPVRYVRAISNRYEAYVQIIDDDAPRADETSRVEEATARSLRVAASSAP
jgi:membrane-bound lytic murein transglycosylase F